MREGRNIQGHLHLVERDLNLARVDERLRETAERGVMEQGSQRTTTEGRKPIEVMPNVALRRRLLLKKDGRWPPTPSRGWEGG